MGSSFKGKTAIVTGGGSGIGRAAALALAQGGANVVVGNRNTERGEAVIQEIAASGGTAVFQPTDVTVPEQVQALVDRAVSDFGGLHLAFNNAGMEGVVAKLHKLDIETASELLDVNVKGIFLCLKYELAEMAGRGGGAVVNNASVLGLKGGRKMAVYAASKHAVAGMTKAAALDYADANIRVNAVAPGPIATRMLHDATDGDPDSFVKFIPQRRIGQPEEVANTVVWLLSEQASYVTGQVVAIDGGWHAQ